MKSAPATEGRRKTARIVFATLYAGVCAGAAAAEPDAEFTSASERAGYSVGYALGQRIERLEQQGGRVALEAVLRGALDALSHAQPQLSEDEIRDELERLEARDSAAIEGDAQPAAAVPPARTRGYMDDFAALNAQRPEVTTLPSGVQYEVLGTGSGQTPGPDDRVAVRYEGRLSTGVVFDSTLDEPDPVHLRIADIAVPGLRDALLHMREGDKWRVVVPPRLGFGASGNNMLRKRDLIYEIELVRVEPPGEGAAATSGDTRGESPARLE